DSAESRRALDRLREWEGTRRGLASARRARPCPRRAKTNGKETAPLRALFDRFNHERFGGRLPDIPLRVSRRMTRSLGIIRYGPDRSAVAAHGARGSRTRPGGAAATDERARAVTEIAISADLLRPANRTALEDTLLHEMAHAEAWLVHGHRGHGRPWRRIAERVGCTPGALCRSPIERGRKSGR
ncbi:MAG: SprT family zinc-dependent metalloprotease, partial [Gemmatimonadota bacterium]